MRTFSFLAALAALGSVAMAQQAPAPFVTKEITKDVYWVNGGGGNSGVLVGKKGVIVIDAKTTPDGGKQLLAEIAKVTPKPVTTVILTHSDGDHVNGLAAFPAGLTIIAHENDKKEQEAALKAGGRGAPPADRLPTKVIDTRSNGKFELDGFKIELSNDGPAHTSGDLVVWLPKQRVAFTGDIIATQRPDPIIHLEKNGSTEGWLKTTANLLGLHATVYIPGHGDPQTQADIQERFNSTQAKHDKIKAMLASGKSPTEIRQALGIPEPAAGRGPAFGDMVDIMAQEAKK